MLSEKLVKMFVKDLRYACADSGDEELERVIDNLFLMGLLLVKYLAVMRLKKRSLNCLFLCNSFILLLLLLCLIYSGGFLVIFLKRNCTVVVLLRSVLISWLILSLRMRLSLLPKIRSCVFRLMCCVQSWYC